MGLCSSVHNGSLEPGPHECHLSPDLPKSLPSAGTMLPSSTNTTSDSRDSQTTRFHIRLSDIQSHTQQETQKATDNTHIEPHMQSQTHTDRMSTGTGTGTG